MAPVFFQRQIRRRGPVAQRLEPALVIGLAQLEPVPGALVVGQLAVQPVLQALGFVGPAFAQGLQLRFLLLQRGIDQGTQL